MRRRSLLGRTVTGLLAVLLAAPAPLAVAAAAPATGVQPTKIAVLNFKNKTGDPKLNPLEDQISELLSIKLAQNRGLRVVERSRLDEAMKELKFQSSGMVEETDIQKIGTFVGASVIVYGSVLRFGGKLRLGSKLLDVKSGSVAQGFDDPVEDEDAIPGHVDQLSFKIVNFLVPAAEPAPLEKPVDRAVERTASPRTAMPEHRAAQRGGMRRAGLVVLAIGTGLLLASMSSGTSATVQYSSYQNATDASAADAHRAGWRSANAGAWASGAIGAAAIVTGGIFALVGSRRMRAQSGPAGPPLLAFQHSF